LTDNKKYKFKKTHKAVKQSVQDICHHYVVVGSTQSDADGAHQAAMEASLSVEVSMIVLDTVTLYVNSFKVILLCVF